jgi:hypothetical protein
MYYDTGIQPLSTGQMRKLMSGGAVRMKMGNHTPVKLSKAQMKKMHSNNAKGKATTIMFDPYQMQMHGSGMFDFLDPNKNGVAQAFQPVAEAFQPGGRGEQLGKEVAKELIYKGIPGATGALAGAAGAAMQPGNPLTPILFGVAGERAGEELAKEVGRQTGYGMRRRKGRGFFEDIRPATDYLRPVGDAAVERAVREIRGSGFFEDIRPATDYLRPVGDAAVERAVREIRGSGVRRRSGKGMFSDIKKGAAKALHVAQSNPVVGKIASKVMDKIPAGAKALGKYAQSEYGIQGGEQLGEMAGTMLRGEIKRRTGLGMRRRGGALRVAGSGMDYC